MWLWTREQAQKIDQDTIAQGISGESLMEEAGKKCAQLLLKLFPDKKNFLILCGPGNNGGDGWVIARELLKADKAVLVLQPEDKNLSAVPTDSVLIDALFGIGLKRNLQSPYIELIQEINQLKSTKVSIDNPSGLDVNTGNNWGAAVQAHYTFCIGHSKPGFFLNEGPELCGQIFNIHLSFNKKSIADAKSVFLLSQKLVRKWLPIRKPTDNKSRGGKCLILAGSAQMPGAAVLACKAAFRVGAGYVYSSQKNVLSQIPEAILCKNNSFSGFRSILVGPGLGVNLKTAQLIKKLRQQKIPVIIDADALTVAAEHHLFPFPQNWIATPHAGELSRFLKLDAKTIERDRISAAALAQKLLGCTVVLKGFHTVVAYAGFSVIVPTGNVALAKGGSGDVLAGMMAGFLSQGVDFERAPLLACFVHGMMADQWVKAGKDYLSLSPSDLLEAIPKTLAGLRKK
jgi:hydroxyethylthiazole kinase-like uncharacterized protein yjeF